MILVPIDHILEAVGETGVHGTPFFAVVTTTAPILRVIHAVPLIVDVDAGVAGMCNVSGGDRVRRRNRVTRNRGHIARWTAIRYG